MRVGPIVHGALLAAALAFAYQTWTREKTEEPKVGTITVWKESVSDFEAFAYDGENKSVRVERRGEGDAAYLWGQVTRTETKRKPKVPAKAAPDDAGGADAHGGHGAGKPLGLPPASKSPTGAAPGKPAGDKRAPGAKPAAPTSPHHAATDQPDKPASPPAKPAATPAKPAPTAKPPAMPAKPGDKSAPTTGAPGAAPASPPDGADGSHPAGHGDADEPGDLGDQVLAAAPEPEETTSKTKEFPVGKTGQELVANLAHLHALRDLGVLTDQQKDEYELTDSKENLTVFFKGGKQRSLIIGARVFGGGDRYVMTPDSGRGYVLSNSEIMRIVDGAETSLGIKGLHEFQDEPTTPPPATGDPGKPGDAKPKRDRYPEVAQVEIETTSGSRTLVRHEKPDAVSGTTIIGWADKQKPDEADVTFGNLLSQIERLRPLEYDTALDPSTLTKVMTLRYVKSGGKVLGTLELFKKEASITPELEPDEAAKAANEAQYYVKSELTRVLGKVGRMSAERVADDLPQLFGAPPKAKDLPKGAPAGSKGADNRPPTPGDKTSPAPAGAKPPGGEPAKPAGSKSKPSEGNK